LTLSAPAIATMKSTASRIERLLAKVEALAPPPRREVLQAIVHEGDDEAGAMEKALAEHIAAHPEHAGLTVKDFRWIVLEFGPPGQWEERDGTLKWVRPDGTVAMTLGDKAAEETQIEIAPEANDVADDLNPPADPQPPPTVLPTAVSAGSIVLAPGGNERGLDGGPDHHRSSVVLSFADGLKERSRRLGRPLQPRQLRRR
jgi:hypothetical protein